MAQTEQLHTKTIEAKASEIAQLQHQVITLKNQIADLQKQSVSQLPQTAAPQVAAPSQNSDLADSLRAALARETEKSQHLESQCKILEDSTCFLKS
jgi:hypothetical protein